MAATCNAPLPPISRPWIPPSNTAPPRPIICARPSAASGWLPFDHWMAEALYAPGWATTRPATSSWPTQPTPPLPAGDFVTAPQLTPLFARTLARQAADVLAQTGTSAVLEFGAGTGALAEGVLRASWTRWARRTPTT